MNVKSQFTFKSSTYDRKRALLLLHLCLNLPNSQGNSVIPVTKLRPVPVLEGTGITEFPWELGDLGINAAVVEPSCGHMWNLLWTF